MIPDKEDPDSYVRKVGAAAFRDFIAANKKDFILFQLEVALKDAGGDTNKKAEVVNRMAETIARINKAEDFTRQQDYIRQCRGDPADRRGRTACAGQQIYPGPGDKAGEPDGRTGGRQKVP